MSDYLIWGLALFMGIGSLAAIIYFLSNIRRK